MDLSNDKFRTYYNYTCVRTLVINQKKKMTWSIEKE